jgi:hypothetical protein
VSAAASLRELGEISTWHSEKQRSFFLPPIFSALVRQNQKMRLADAPFVPRLPIREERELWFG